MFFVRTGLAACLALGLAGCTSGDRTQANRDASEAGQRTQEAADSAARKAGRAAHDVADDTKEAAKKAGKALSEVGREAREGWQEGGRRRNTPEKK